MGASPIRIATRGSRLALAQTDAVIEALRRHHPDRVFEKTILTTRGDRVLDRPLPELGGKGLFTAELEEALRGGEVDMAVHSVKDLPVDLPEGFRLGCVPMREDPRDVLVSRDGHALADLPAGSRIGTSSPRRQAQLVRARPDLVLVDLRGNVETRLRKVREGECDAAILAAAGLRRLGLEDAITEMLDPSVLLPPAGQGAIGIEVRDGDRETARLLAPLEAAERRAEVEAELYVLRRLGGGCKTPIGAHAVLSGDEIRLRAGVWSPDGSAGFVAESRGHAHDTALVGKAVADRLIEQGAAELIEREEG